MQAGQRICVVVLVPGIPVDSHSVLSEAIAL